MEEQWRDILIEDQVVKGYKVSNRGEVLSTKYKQPRILKAGENGRGRLQVTLSIEGKLRKFLVNRLVAEAFVPNPNNLPIVDHKDTNPLNNWAENLRWVTGRTNMQNRRKRLEGNTTSQYVGVYQDALSGKWAAKICFEYKSFYLGRFDTEVEAAMKYDKALIEMGFEPANFIIE